MTFHFTDSGLSFPYYQSLVHLRNQYYIIWIQHPRISLHHFHTPYNSRPTIILTFNTIQHNPGMNPFTYFNTNQCIPMQDVPHNNWLKPGHKWKCWKWEAQHLDGKIMWQHSSSMTPQSFNRCHATAITLAFFACWNVYFITKMVDNIFPYLWYYS